MGQQKMINEIIELAELLRDAKEYKDVAEFQQNLAMERWFEIGRLKRKLDESEKEIGRLESILNDYALQYGTVKDKAEVLDKARIECAKQIFNEMFEFIDYMKFDSDYDIVQFEKHIKEIEKRYTGE